MARRYETRVAVIGSGAAGMMAALAVAKTCPVLLITDRKLGRSNSLMAQGGLQVPPDDAAERDAMVEDMLASSRGRSSREKVRWNSFSREAETVVKRLRLATLILEGPSVPLAELP